MSKTTVKAVCHVVLQISCDSVWNADTTMEQIIKQAEEDVSNRIRRLFIDACTPDKELTVERSDTHGVSLVGVTKIVTQAVVDKC